MTSRPSTQDADHAPARTTITGSFRPHRRGFGFVTAPDGTSVFVPPPLARTLVDGDTVTGPVDVEPGRDGGGKLTSVDRTVRHRRLVVGSVSADGRHLTPHPQLATVDLPLPRRMRRAAGKVVAVTLDGGGGRPAVGEVVAGPTQPGSPQAARMVALVVALGAATPNAHDPDLAARLGLDRTDQVCHDRLVAALDGDRDLPDGRTRAPLPDATPPASVDRSDLTGTFTFTIDGPTSADLDDAISARWNGDDSPVTVQVHIADVAAAVPAGSRLDRRARLLATSTYLAGLSMPMLPADLSEDRCSLLPGQERDTLTVTFDVHADGTVGDTDVFASTVRSDVRLDYRQVAEHMAGSARLPAATAGPVDAAAEAARRLQEDRDDRPTLSHLFDHDRPEAHVDGGAVRLVTPSDDAAHALIEALMVAANEQVASWLHDRDVACLFRVHDGVDPDRAELLDAVADTAGVTLDGYTPEALTDAFEQVDGPWADGMVSAALSAMSRAEYATGLRDHSGLGSARYCHFTSPIRRYADLVVHRQVRAVLAGDTPAPAAQLDDVAAWVNVRAGASSRAEAVEQMLLWASTFDVAGGPVSTVAQVCKVVPAGVQVRLDGSGLPAFLPASVFGRRKLATARGGHATADFSVHVGQRRPVQVVDVDPLGELEVTAA